MSTVLKFITCGSVDDGKSTLIGHMLYNTKLLCIDHLQALKRDSEFKCRKGELDYSLLLDGLIAEREQGITIDIAYRFFSTEVRSFIVADCPGHEQYTRNMAVGASFADVAVILVDASKGILLQTKRHVRICALMGIKHFILAVNKMDLVSYDRDVFCKIKNDFLAFISDADIDIMNISIIPISATEGDNITELSNRMSWYEEKPLLTYLEQLEIEERLEKDNFALPVQLVCRVNSNRRGYQGQLEYGQVSMGDKVIVLPSGESANIDALYVLDKPVAVAHAGQPITVLLDRQVDVSRGCVLVGKENFLQVFDRFTATVLWMDDVDLVIGQSYYLKCGTKTLPVEIRSVQYKIDMNTGEHIEGSAFGKNEIAICDLLLSGYVVFDELKNNTTLGGFILIDRVTNATCACGAIMQAGDQLDSKWKNETYITPRMRADQKKQNAFTIWFTGLSGAGKTVLSKEIEKELYARGYHTMALDGDELRYGLCKDLGFIVSDRIENVRRIAETARILNNAGVICLVSCISPLDKSRQMAKEIIGDDAFFLVYVNTPIEVCEQRDTKGLYRKARNGEIENFTGITSDYEAPSDPQLSIDTCQLTIEESKHIILQELLKLM